MCNQDFQPTIHSQSSNDSKKDPAVAHKLFYNLKSIRIMCGSVPQLFCFKLSSKSRYKTPSVKPIASCCAKIITLPLTHKAVMTWKHCNCSPGAFLQSENYYNMWFSTTTWPPNPRHSLLDARATNVNHCSIGMVPCPFEDIDPTELNVNIANNLPLQISKNAPS